MKLWMKNLTLGILLPEKINTFPILIFFVIFPVLSLKGALLLILSSSTSLKKNSKNNVINNNNQKGKNIKMIHCIYNHILKTRTRLIPM
jgi:hypothetical protein